MSLQSNCVEAVSGAYRATPIRDSEAEVRVPWLGIYLDSICEQFSIRLEKLEAARVMKVVKNPADSTA